MQVKKGNLWQSLALLQVGESSAGFSCRRPDNLSVMKAQKCPRNFLETKHEQKKQHQDLFACIFDCIRAISLGGDVD